MIMLIGIVKKNDIMMIDFALQWPRSDLSISPEMAIYEAAMMGTLPIALATGVGADSRRPLGLCAAGRLLFSQLLTLVLTPVLYTYLERIGSRFTLFRPSEVKVARGAD